MIVQLIIDIVESFNESSKCDRCWRFIHSRSDYANLANPCKGDECCTNFILHSYSHEKRYSNDENQRNHELIFTDYSIELFVGVPSSLDIAYHNEDELHVENSKYETIIRPIEECMIGFEQELCDKGFHIIRWRQEPRVNFNSSNMDGIRINATFRNYE